MVISRKSSQLGLTIIELMVGLVLGLFLLGGVLHIYLGSSQTYRTTEALSRVQESGRFAIDFLADDLRNTGGAGACPRGSVNNLLNENGDGYEAALFEFDEALLGWESGNGGYGLDGYRAATDIVLLKHAGRVSGVTASGNTPSNANTINLTAASGIAQGQIVTVSDGESCDVFQNRSAPNASALTRGASSSNPGPGNKNPGEHEFSKSYGEGMEIRLMRSSIYYIGNRNVDALPTLRRVRYDSADGVSEELVEGIVDMQLCYGVDLNQDGSADSYVQADAVGGWSDVVAVRATLIAISPEINVATEVPVVQYAACNGAVVNRTVADYPEFGQRRLARVFTSTIALRNRLQ